MEKKENKDPKVVFRDGNLRIETTHTLLPDTLNIIENNITGSANGPQYSRIDNPHYINSMPSFTFFNLYLENECIGCSFLSTRQNTWQGKWITGYYKRFFHVLPPL